MVESNDTSDAKEKRENTKVDQNIARRTCRKQHFCQSQGFNLQLCENDLIWLAVGIYWWANFLIFLISLLHGKVLCDARYEKEQRNPLFYVKPFSVWVSLQPPSRDEPVRRQQADYGL